MSLQCRLGGSWGRQLVLTEGTGPVGDQHGLPDRRGRRHHGRALLAEQAEPGGLRVRLVSVQLSSFDV